MNLNHKTLLIVTAALLLMGIPSILPYGYYIFLRWVVCITGLVVAFQYNKLKSTSWHYIFGAVAILFNPIAPIYLDKSAWIIIDLITSGFFLFAWFDLKNNVNNHKK